jgi:hypothetical protein
MDQGATDDDGAREAFEAITEGLADLRRDAELEQLGEAREIVADGLATRRFLDEVRRIAPGDVVTVVAADHHAVTGRILRVGADWVRVGEIVDASGTRRVRLHRVHDIRLDAIVRLTREPAE